MLFCVTHLEGKKLKGCRVLTDNEVSIILDNLSIRDSVLFQTMLYFGTRISETIGLKFADVEGDYFNVSSCKHSENITFPIPNDYKNDLSLLRSFYEDYKTTGGQEVKITGKSFLFLSRQNNFHLCRFRASQIIKNMCRRLKLSGKINTHSFRKCFVTKIYELTGKDIIKTKVYSRHKNLSNLEYYIKTTETTELINDLSWKNKG